MNITTCQFCRKPFATLGGKICPACMEQIDKDFITIRDYIDEHKHSNIDLISEETEVPRNIIMHLIKEGRLIIDSPAGDGGGYLFCEVCKKPINTGRMCDDCKKTISSKIDNTVSSHSHKPREASSGGQSLKGSARLGQK